jgi:hypothetical protein
MRLTLIIASAIFFALMAYARLLAVVHDASIPTLYEGVTPHQTIQPRVIASQSN